MKTLAVYNVKGGVSKTSSTVNLADQACRGGAKVLLWDFDPQGAATFYCGAGDSVDCGTKNLLPENGSLYGMIEKTENPGLDLLSASFSLRRSEFVMSSGHDLERRFRHVLASLPGSYDYVFIDCAPGITLAAECVFQSVDAVLVPVIPTTLSVLAFDQLNEFLRREAQVSIPVMPFFSMVDWRKNLHRDLVLELRAEKPGFLQTVIPNATEVERMGVHRAPLGAFAPKCRPALAYAEMWREIQEVLGTGQVAEVGQTASQVSGPLQVGMTSLPGE